MDFDERIEELSRQIHDQLPHIQTEEATKNALIMPFITALGYNVFNPTEVTPELHADVGLKKGEKVDYAILRDGKPIMLFECKWHGADLSKEHASQLYRYFSVTEARFGVLTNGRQYWFFTDLEAPNKMDAKPFFIFDMFDHREQDIEELKKFSKSTFDVQHILTTASELKYTAEIQKILARELKAPSEEFVRFFTAQVYQGRMTQTVREQFTQTTQRAFRQFINEQINDRLKSALNSDTQVSVAAPTTTVPLTAEAVVPTQDAVSTTNDEWAAFYTIRAILFTAVEPHRVAMRDVQTYCGVLLDDNNRKPICRLYFNRPRKQIGIFDGEGRKEQRVAIDSVDEIHQYADRLRATVNSYAPSLGPSTSEGLQRDTGT